MGFVRRIGRAWPGRHLCLLLAACLLIAPVAAEAADLATDDCAAVEVHDVEPGGEHSDAGHAHHAHSCGGCHMHLLNVRAVAPDVTAEASVQIALPLMEAPLQAPPGGLFRPPRS